MTDEAFNHGLAAFLDDMSPEAVKKKVPRISETALKKLMIEYQEVFSAACRCVRNGLEDHKTEVILRDEVAAIDERVSPANATMLYAIARTSAWRDGYS